MLLSAQRQNGMSQAKTFYLLEGRRVQNNFIYRSKQFSPITVSKDVDYYQVYSV